MSCPICCDDMDMKEYSDEQQSTSTCFKLECGHAYHTRCIVAFLTKSTHKCPSCNKQKTPEEKLERQGVIYNLVKEVKKDERVKLATNEFKIAVAEYKHALKVLRDETKEWVKQRSKELKIREYKNYYSRSGKNVLETANEVAKEFGNTYTGAVMSADREERRWGTTVAKRILFGTFIYGFNDWRLRLPRISIGIT